MAFNIKPKLSKYMPHPCSKGWGVLNMETGKLLRKKDHRHRIEYYMSKTWAENRCKKLNEQED